MHSYKRPGMRERKTMKKDNTPKDTKNKIRDILGIEQKTAV